MSQIAVYFCEVWSVKLRIDEKVVRRDTGPVGCPDAAGMRGGIIIPGIIGGIMPGI